jgi:hypothetical protein
MQKVHKIPTSTNGWVQWHTPVIIAMSGSRNRRLKVQAGLNIK